ncbi:MAG: crossover junction endodeoxyribonuclease RuvC [Acidobacteria bacterium]|nr:crossover junction endodeoxyribonuclease RuvC [Acidobacteriota bacterium]
MRVIGIDPGSDKTGYGVVDFTEGRHRAVSWGVLKGSGAVDFPARLRQIHEELSAVVNEMRPHCAAVEDIFYAVNVRSSLKLGHTRGAILLSLALADVATVSYSPLEIKKSLVGYGRASKEQVRTMVCRLLNLRAEDIPMDASDALATALCHIHHAQTRHNILRRGR